MTPLTRAIRAGCDAKATDGCECCWPACEDEMPCPPAAIIRAALAAIAEPTEGMTIAGEGVWGSFPPDVWRAMHADMMEEPNDPG